MRVISQALPNKQAKNTNTYTRLKTKAKIPASIKRGVYVPTYAENKVKQMGLTTKGERLYKYYFNRPTNSAFGIYERQAVTARNTRMSVATVQRALRDMVRLGLVDVIASSRGTKLGPQTQSVNFVSVRDAKRPHESPETRAFLKSGHFIGPSPDAPVAFLAGQETYSPEFIEALTTDYRARKTTVPATSKRRTNVVHSTPQLSTPIKPLSQPLREACKENKPSTKTPPKGQPTPKAPQNAPRESSRGEAAAEIIADFEELHSQTLTPAEKRSFARNLRGNESLARKNLSLIRAHPEIYLTPRREGGQHSIGRLLAPSLGVVAACARRTPAYKARAVEEALRYNRMMRDLALVQQPPSEERPPPTSFITKHSDAFGNTWEIPI